ncbi:MAG: hypothetical protein Q3M24_21850 [Candidatus Electrothrix aestuarii]|uniref:Uncharacterized protein n=1 Tax=Candidatus Electrothrix aestuarii TaxID=3062594 RepID=A0AAU8LUG4_9BACT|nr:hypothetical protein [Candidatus Electrothrix aestuarii]
MEALFAKITDPVAIYVILVAAAIGWLLSKYKEVAAWKELFSKNRVEKLKKAREELIGIPEEAEFYDEALRQEIFRTVTGIRCGKKHRPIYQKLVTDGVASVEWIRHAWTYIDENNGSAEVKVSCTELIMAILLILIELYGIVLMSVSLLNVTSLFDLSRYSNSLFILSFGVFCVFLPLRQLPPMLLALAIRKRLKEKEQEDAFSSPPPPAAEEQSSSPQEAELE